MANTSSGRPLTGRKVAIIVVGAFSVVIAVNMVLAWKAVSTFPGLEARNGFIASQGFEARRAAQAALGWTLEVAYSGDELVLTFRDAQGSRVSPSALDVLVGRHRALPPPPAPGAWRCRPMPPLCRRGRATSCSRCRACIAPAAWRRSSADSPRCRGCAVRGST